MDKSPLSEFFKCFRRSEKERKSTPRKTRTNKRLEKKETGTDPESSERLQGLRRHSDRRAKICVV